MKIKRFSIILLTLIYALGCMSVSGHNATNAANTTYDEIYAEWSTQYTDDGTNDGKYKLKGILVDIVNEYFDKK